MPAQGNVTAPLAVLRMKKPFIHEKSNHFHPAVRPTGTRCQQPIGTAIEYQWPCGKQPSEYRDQ
jgi:hypothetical protein